MNRSQVLQLNRSEYNSLVNLCTDVYVSRCAKQLELSAPSLELCFWLTGQYLTSAKIQSGFGSIKGWSLELVEAVILNLVRLGYVHSNPTGYQKLSTGEVKPLYNLTEKYHCALDSIPFPKVTDAEVGNLFIEQQFKRGSRTYTQLNNGAQQ